MVRRKAIQGEQLAGGEMIVRDLRVDGLHMLKVDAEVVVAAHGKSGDVAAVSQVEMNRLRGGVELNSRLAIGKCGEVIWAASMPVYPLNKVRMAAWAHT